MENDDFDFVKEYNLLKEKNSLPKYEELAEDFDVEKLLEKESNFLLREVRRAMGEKFGAYLHLFETLINPSSPPMFVFSFLRSLNEGDKEKIKSIYKQLSKLQVKIMKLDTVYSEKAEVHFIKESFTEWQDLKKIIYGLVESFEEGLEKDNGSRKGGYLG